MIGERADSAERRSEAAGPLPKKKDPKILVVDGNELFGKLLLLKLQKAGYRDLLFSLGNEGLLKARSEAPDLIILGAVLSDGSGFDVCKAIRESRELAGARVLLMSEAPDYWDAVKAREAGGATKKSWHFLGGHREPEMIPPLIQAGQAQLQNRLCAFLHK